MKKQKKGLAIGLTMVVLLAIFMTFATLALGPPTATHFGVEDAIGYKDTQVLIPVNITNVQNGPVPAIIFNILYNNSVINVVDVQRGSLTSDWKEPSLCNYDWGTRIALVYNASNKHPIPGGWSGSVVLLNCSVIGGSEDTSELNFWDVQLAEGGPFYQVGTASAKNGTFRVLEYGLITGKATDSRGRNIEGITVTLKTRDSGVVKGNTITNETGYFSLTNVEVGDYDLRFSKPRYIDYSTTLTVQSGETKTVNIILLRRR